MASDAKTGDNESKTSGASGASGGGEGEDYYAVVRIGAGGLRGRAGARDALVAALETRVDFDVVIELAREDVYGLIRCAANLLDGRGIAQRQTTGSSGVGPDIGSVADESLLTEAGRRQLESCVVKYWNGPIGLRDALRAGLSSLEGGYPIPPDHRLVLLDHADGWFAQAHHVRALLASVDRRCAQSPPSPNLASSSVPEGGDWLRRLQQECRDWPDVATALTALERGDRLDSGARGRLEALAAKLPKFRVVQDIARLLTAIDSMRMDGVPACVERLRREAQFANAEYRASRWSFILDAIDAYEAGRGIGSGARLALEGFVRANVPVGYVEDLARLLAAIVESPGLDRRESPSDGRVVDAEGNSWGERSWMLRCLRDGRPNNRSVSAAAVAKMFHAGLLGKGERAYSLSDQQGNRLEQHAVVLTDFGKRVLVEAEAAHEAGAGMEEIESIIEDGIRAGTMGEGARWRRVRLVTEEMGSGGADPRVRPTRPVEIRPTRHHMVASSDVYAERKVTEFRSSGLGLPTTPVLVRDALAWAFRDGWLAAGVDGRAQVPDIGAPVSELERCARAHGDAARVYERAGNATGAAELRRVENLLWALLRDQRWHVILPVPEDGVLSSSLGRPGTSGGPGHRRCTECGEVSASWACQGCGNPHLIDALDCTMHCTACRAQRGLAPIPRAEELDLAYAQRRRSGETPDGVAAELPPGDPSGPELASDPGPPSPAPSEIQLFVRSQIVDLLEDEIAGGESLKEHWEKCGSDAFKAEAREEIDRIVAWLVRDGRRAP